MANKTRTKLELKFHRSESTEVIQKFYDALTISLEGTNPDMASGLEFPQNKPARIWADGLADTVNYVSATVNMLRADMHPYLVSLTVKES